MALWQFTVIAALLGAVLIYANILANRIGRANAALQRIEEALLARNDGLITPSAIEATETPGISEIPESPEATPPPGISDEYIDAPRYLTIRDLKVRSELQRSRATPSESPDALNTGGDIPRSKLRSLFAFGTRGEDEKNDAPSLESREAVDTSDELPSAPATHPANDESDAKKARDVLVFLSNQRRRRRARQGY